MMISELLSPVAQFVPLPSELRYARSVLKCGLHARFSFSEDINSGLLVSSRWFEKDFIF